MATRNLFPRGSRFEGRRIAEILREETVGGGLLLVATVAAMAWANSPWSGGYTALRDTVVGPAALHLDLSLGVWASDGLLAVFFFVAGLELKREFVAGDLRDPRRAALPVLAAIGGMILPAIVYVGVNWQTGDGALKGWAVPIATDIAFAVAVLAVISTHLPSGLRTFLLTLAVVDDLLAIVVIALFYTSDLNLTALLLTLLPLAAFAFCVQRRIRSWWLLLPLGVLTWGLMHASGVHATIAGVLLGFTVPVLCSTRRGTPDAEPSLAEYLEHHIRPVSAGIAVPVFAFFAAGVAIGGVDGLLDALDDTVTLGIVAGLVLGKTFGVFATTYLVARFTHARLDDDLHWLDVFGMSVLAGIGFTVSLLIGELAFGTSGERDDHVKVGVLLGSVTAAVAASIILRARNRVYRRAVRPDPTGCHGPTPDNS